jgi:tetratricopeptide (TPR) repeat protein
MMIKIIAFSLLCFCLISCNNETVEQQTKEITKTDTSLVNVDSCTILNTEARRIDAILINATDLNEKVADNAIKSFFNFAMKCKNDSLSPIFLVKAGQVAQSIHKYTQAQSCFTKCIDEFPDFKNRGAAMFLLAQLYDDKAMLNNESEARTIYDQIIREYPKSPFANDAKACIKNIGKTDEQLIEEFLKKNK